MRTRSRSFGLALVATLLLTGCGDDATSDSSSASARSGSITVSAATSLTGPFRELADDFVAAHADVEVQLNFDGSSSLARQIEEGASVDVFASADETTMAELRAAELIAARPKVFARNTLVIVTKPGNPAGITTLRDLTGAGVISLCGEGVPCGRYAADVLQRAGITIPESRITRGQNVGATLAAVADGDAVAGIVYVTDAESAADRVEAVPIPTGANVTTTYPIGVVRRSLNAEIAAAFVTFVLSDEGQAVLSRHGLRPPS